MSKKRKVTLFILGVLLTSILAILSKQLWPSDIGTEDFDSLFVKLIGFPAVASLYFVFIYAYNAGMMLHFGKNSKLSAIRTGLRFGLTYGLIYLIGMEEVMVESSPYDNWGMNYVIYQLVMGSGEAIAALLLCLVFAKFFLRKKELEDCQFLNIKRKIITISVIACAFTVERAFAYETGLIASNVKNFPVPSYGWTILFGIILGVCVILLFPVFDSVKNNTRKCLYITVITMGVSWMIFNSFIGFIYAGELLNLLIRSGLDVVVLFFATWICFYRKKEV